MTGVSIKKQLIYGLAQIEKHRWAQMILSAFICVFFICVHPCYAESGQYIPPVVRVAVIKDADSLKLRIKSRFNILPLNGSTVLHSASFMSTNMAEPTAYGIKIGGLDFKVYGIRILPARDSAIAINDRPFRGEIDIIRDANAKLLVINHVNIEDYIKGVLYHEISHRWPMAAMEAQAIASRTYAAYQISLNKNKDYDVTNTVYSQVYGGSRSEKYRTNKAVIKTAGKILVYKDEVLPAFFHAACGGHTEDASVLWKVDMPPLDGIACPFCEGSKHYRWRFDMPVPDMVKKLRWNKYLIEDIISIAPLEKNRSGRVVMLRINTGKEQVDMSGKDFRRIIGADKIRSANFRAAVSGGNVYFEGLGWGHGVGMCQWGAYFMSKKGYSAEEILQHYYPGSEIKGVGGW